MVKTLKQRVEEVKNLYAQLDKLGLDERFEGILHFRDVAADYVRSGKPSSGIIPLESVQRVLYYDLTTKNDVVCSIVLKSQTS